MMAFRMIVPYIDILINIMPKVMTVFQRFVGVYRTRLRTVGVHRPTENKRI